jgi:hypothetical protein
VDQGSVDLGECLRRCHRSSDDFMDSQYFDSICLSSIIRLGCGCTLLRYFER